MKEQARIQTRQIRNTINQLNSHAWRHMHVFEQFEIKHNKLSWQLNFFNGKMNGNTTHFQCKMNEGEKMNGKILLIVNKLDRLIDRTTLNFKLKKGILINHLINKQYQTNQIKLKETHLKKVQRYQIKQIKGQQHFNIKPLLLDLHHAHFPSDKMQTRINFREDPSNYAGCVSVQNSQQEQIISSQPYSQKLFPSGQLNQLNYDLHRRVFGQELSNYSTMTISNPNSQSQKTIGMSQVSQQNLNKKLSAQTDMEGMKYYDKLNRGIQIQQHPQQYPKNYYTSKTPGFFDNNGAQIAQLVQQPQQQQQQQQEWLCKEAKKRKEYIESLEGVVNISQKTQEPLGYKGDYTQDLNYQTNTIAHINPTKGQRLISDQDISNYSTTNSSNDNFEIQSITIENAKTRNQKEVERQYAKIMSEDKSNPNRVAQYSREIFQHLKQKEKQLLINKNYIEEQPDISEHMRWILIDWLIEVHFKFKLLQETLFIAVYVIDKYLSLTQIKRGKLQLVGITALFIAAKYEEIYPPELHEFSEITDRACSKRDILQMEGEIICALNFQITVPSAYRFAEWYTRLADFQAKDQCLVFYFIEMTILDTRFLKYSPSNIAASAVYMVNKLNKNETCWSELLEKDSGYAEQRLRPCAKDLIFIQQKLQTSVQKAVATKYSRPQFYRVGQMVLNSKQDSNIISTKAKPYQGDLAPYRSQQPSLHQQYNSSNYISTKD